MNFKKDENVSDKLTFRSSLSIDEIEENFKNIDVFDGITEGLQEVLRKNSKTEE